MIRKLISVWLVLWLYRAAILLLATCSIDTTARAQDAFHIRVHEYETLAPGEFNVELHSNYVAVGTRSPDGLAAPTNNQLHLAYELTGGITSSFSMGAMLLNGRRVGRSLEYAGWKILPHLFAPRSWHLPLDLGVVAEFSSLQSAYDRESRSLEIHLVLAKNIGRFIFDVNPSLERAFTGPDRQGGWVFRPAAQVRYPVLKWLTPRVEYYGQSAAFHHVVGGADFRLQKDISLSLGVGAGPTPAGNRLVYASRIAFELGKKENRP
jgi:hypothetical protein